MSVFDLNAVISQLGRDKGIDRQAIVELIESAVLSAAKKHFGHNVVLETQLNEDTGEVEILQFKTVVEEVSDPDTQIVLSDARAEFDEEAMVGDEIGKKLDNADLGRIAAQTAKQVIIQKVRDAERGVIFEEYKNSKGEIINGIVQRYDRGNLIINLGRTEAILPKREAIPRERYRQGDRIRGMILDIDRLARGPQIIITRSHPEFLKKLFEIEVPEIAERVIEIKGVAREPGDRAKISVHSNDANVDPVGACVGVKGSRVQAVVQELRGERVDIITWTPDEPSFVARALSPAEVSRVVVDETNHSMEVIVADDQLSLAIGRRGQNVKLAAKLSGWKIDVRSVSVAEEDARRARASIESIPGIEFTLAELLYQYGFRSPKEVAEAYREDLLEIDGVTEENVGSIIENAKKRSEEMEIEAEEAGMALGSVTDLHRLMISEELKNRLISGGYGTIQALVTANNDELLSVEGIGEEELTGIREATDAFFKHSAASMRNLAER